MADFTDTVSIELQQSTKQTSTGIAKVVNDLKQLHNGMTVGMTGVRSLQKQFQELGVNLSNSKIKSSISSINSDTLKYVTTSGKMVTVNRKVKNGLDSYRVSIKNVNKELKNGTSLWSAFTQGLSGAITKFRIIYDTMSRFAIKLVDLVQGATAYEEALNLFTVSMGQQAEEATKWIERFSEALYLDPSNVMQYMGSLNSLIGGLGVGAEKSYLMSKNLTQLAYDLASFKNMKFEEAFTKLQSGISGEIEPLRNVGVALSQNTLQELANSLGIKQRVAEMSEAQKAQLRYVQILKSTTQWQGDMGRTLISPANSIRVLKEQFALLGRAIGSVFIPIVMKAIPYVMALTEILTDLANRLAAFLGYELTDIDYSSLGNISTGITDIGDAAEETTNKLNTMLAPFDELNVVQNKSKKAGDGLGGLGGDLGIDLPEYDALAGLTEQFKKNVDNAKESLSQIFDIVTLIGIAFGSWKIASGINLFLKNWKTIRPDFKKTVGLTFVLSGIALTTKGQLDIKEDYWKGIMEKITGTVLTGAGTYILTKNIGLSLIVTGVSFMIQSGLDEKSMNGALLPQLEKLGGLAGIAGGTYLLTKSVTITLLVTLGASLISIGNSISELQKLNPTFEEIRWAFSQMMLDFFNGVPILSDFGRWLGGFFYDLFNITIPETFDGIVIASKKTWKSLTDWWNGSVGKIFTLAFWVTLMNNIKNGISDGLDTIKEKWNTKWSEIGTWWDENIGKYFTISFWQGKMNDIKTSISKGMSDFSYNWQQGWNTVTNWWDRNIGKYFTLSFWTNKVDTIKTGISNGLESLKSSFSDFKINIKTPHFEWVEGGTKAKGLIKDALEALNLPTSIPKLKVNWYAEGGFPKAGELFVAREAGAEMVGKIGNQTAVANNDQITTSITNALITALNSYGFGDNKPGTTIVNIGGKKVYEGVGDYVDSENDRYGTNYVHV